MLYAPAQQIDVVREQWQFNFIAKLRDERTMHLEIVQYTGSAFTSSGAYQGSINQMTTLISWNLLTYNVLQPGMPLALKYVWYLQLRVEATLKYLTVVHGIGVGLVS